MVNRLSRLRNRDGITSDHHVPEKRIDGARGATGMLGSARKIAGAVCGGPSEPDQPVDEGSVVQQGHALLR